MASTWAKQRKFILFLTFLFLIASVVSIVFFGIFFNVPSCSDGKQNQNEIGIDCGGACLNSCEIGPKPVVDVWVRAFPLASTDEVNVYSAVAYIENQNLDLYSPSIQYEFTFFDEKGNLVRRASDFTAVMPGITAVFVPHVVAGVRKISGASFRFVNPVQLIPLNSKLDFEFSNKNIGDKTVSVTVQNTSNLSLINMDFVAIVYDELGVAIAASRSFKENILAGESFDLVFTWPNEFSLTEKKPCLDGGCFYEPVRLEIIPVFSVGS